MRRKFTTFVLLACLFQLPLAHAEIGVTATEIKIGNTAASSGPEGVYGQQLGKGAKAYYDKVNAAGGINGRKISYVFLDDAYEPDKAVVNVKKLVEEDNIFALVGGNGTAGTKAFYPYVLQKNLPMLFRYTGGDLLYEKPPKPGIFQLRISYAQEAENLIDFAVKKLSIQDVGVFYQDDGFGVAGRAGVAKALAKYNFKIAVDGTHKRNELEMSKAVQDFLKARPKAIYVQTNQVPAAKFIGELAAKGYKPIFLSSSPMNSVKTMKALGKDAENFYISEVVPNSLDPSIPVVKNYQADMKAIGETEFEPISLEGYMGAALFVEALKRMGPEVTRANLNKALETMSSYDLGGVKVSFSPTQHQALSSGFLVLLKGGKIVSLTN